MRHQSRSEKRGGTESLKEDLSELKDIANGEGSLVDKAKAAAEVLKASGDDVPGGSSPRRP